MKHALGSLCLIAALALPGALAAHPHVWVGGGASFGVNDKGQLDRLHVTWIYDTFASIYLLSYLGADQDGDQKLNAEDKKKILADQTNWPDGFAGDSYLYVSGAKQKMGKPQNADTRILEDGRVEVTFERMLETPYRPGGGEPDAIVKVYDPTFYYAYEISAAPKIVGPDGHGCAVTHKPYDADDPQIQALQVELSKLGRDETPEQQDVGAIFADELRLSCD